ncbi:hypothetical protein RHSIM_Rhsim03G0184900 [Rhododendron simsii]|uniref:Glycosyl transferase CAP10 domain-containing protein n=1 Tax=Rhododendron simsii TaxID=118357 RepID=A0A834LVU1_RHOSS|nr:hypothetical protein RHSIM_Rhsim03G0184900 [Rhododendron simsii]
MEEDRDHEGHGAEGKKTANFRLVIVDGRAYMERYVRAFQNRDVFTVWGILQLLRRYPGKILDLDLMFDCVDWPVVKAVDYSAPNATAPPLLFRYCRDDATLDIVFPNWSFWGWAEINIKPLEGLLEELKEGNKRKRWMDREAYAYWKGNTVVAATRVDLLKCNISDKQGWGARLYNQDWIKETREGYKQSNLASQCMHRYKIYIEGSAWSAQEIGKAASDFIQEDLQMDNVYYMFHLLSEYAKLMRYKPTIPKRAIEICSGKLACPTIGSQKKFIMESMVKGPTDMRPCNMPPPYDALALHNLLKRKANSISQVELWEKRYWENQTKHN